MKNTQIGQEELNQLKAWGHSAPQTPTPTQLDNWVLQHQGDVRTLLSLEETLDNFFQRNGRDQGARFFAGRATPGRIPAWYHLAESIKDQVAYSSQYADSYLIRGNIFFYEGRNILESGAALSSPGLIKLFAIAVLNYELAALQRPAQARDGALQMVRYLDTLSEDNRNSILWDRTCNYRNGDVGSQLYDIISNI